MIKSLRHLFPLATLTMVLLLALPVAAQQSDNPSGDPSQRDPAPSPEICVPVGTALAVLADDAVLAKIIGPATRNVDPAAATGRVITLDGPATVGACGQAQGYWDDGVTGFAAANLDLLGANAVSLTSPVASDAYKADKTGPATGGAALRAMVQLTRPGTYPFVALFRVRAGRPAATAAQPGDQAADEVKVAFTVVIRGRGTISGRVMSGGQPVAGATVRADAPRTASVRSGAVELPPVDLPGVLGGEASDSRLASTTAVTNRNGEYTLAVPTGKYVVAAQARGLKVQWYHLKDSARDADPVAVTPDALAVTGVDFDLVAPDRPQPAKAGTITGRVVDEDGNPVAGATVTASGPATSRDPAGGGNTTVVAATDEQGVLRAAGPGGRVAGHGQRCPSQGAVVHRPGRRPRGAAQIEQRRSRCRGGHRLVARACPRTQILFPVGA